MHQRDQKVIRQLERELGLEIPQLSGPWLAYWLREPGFLLNESGRVIELNLNETNFCDFSKLQNLQSLRLLCLYRNRIEDLKTLQNLSSLMTLYLNQNRIRDLGPLANLSALTRLDLSLNQIQDLTPLKNLSGMIDLDLSGNQIQELTPLKNLSGLIHLSLQHNQIQELGPLENLGNLKSLFIDSNQIKDLSPLKGLNFKRLDFEENPITTPPQEVLALGQDAVLEYLRSLSGRTTQRYQAKLLLLGDGGEGKTCLSRALRDQNFQEQPTTHGVEFHPWTFPNPEDIKNPETQITLTIWDFEGQEIIHQSHQFFLTRRSLYVIVFSGRKQIKQERLSYWLDSVRNRAPNCQVLLVATECEGRTPTFDLERLQAAYPDLLVENPFYAIDSKSMKNIQPLRQRLAQLAVSLELVPQTWPESLQKAEDRIAEMAGTTPEIERFSLLEIFAESGIGPRLFEIVARMFGDMGIITHFPDSPNLRNRIVLRPQWLTRAISFAMEHEQLTLDQGEMDHKWLAALWEKEFPGFFTSSMPV